MAFHRNDAPIQDIWNDPDERFGEVVICDSDSRTGEIYRCSSLTCPVHGSRNRMIQRVVAGAADSKHCHECGLVPLRKDQLCRECPMLKGTRFEASRLV